MICKICNAEFEALGVHLRAHKITAAEYEEQYGEEVKFTKHNSGTFGVYKTPEVSKEQAEQMHRFLHPELYKKEPPVVEAKRRMSFE